MDINAAVGGKAGLSREQIEAALSLQDSSHLSGADAQQAARGSCRAIVCLGIQVIPC